MSSASGPRGATIEPEGFVVLVPPGDRIHFLDWGGDVPRTVVLIHGLAGSALAWTPIARRLASAVHVVAMDLRGHGLSDSPTESGAYDLDVLASDVVAVADAATEAPGDVVLAGLGFGAIVAAAAAERLGDRCAGVVLVDGGLVDVATASGVDVEEFLRGVDEPPEVMRSMSAYLADRRSWDPTSWDGDQEAAARAAVVETPAGRLVPTTRRDALEACVRAMFAYAPSATLAEIRGPIVAVARRAPPGDEDATAIAAEPAGTVQLIEVDAPGHNLLRYRPDEVAGAIWSLTSAGSGG